MDIKKKALSASEEVLGFNPKSKKEDIFRVVMTPKMARYILLNHNKHNRKFVVAQLKAINHSVYRHNWLHTGDTCAFDTTGNLTEFQHRLENIASGIKNRIVWIATGVRKDTFEKAAPSKNRTKFDVVWRYEKSATKDEVTTLEQVLRMRKGKDKQSIDTETLTMVNALSLFRVWKEYIRIGMNITNKFFEDKKVRRFLPWQRILNAWATILVFQGKDEIPKNFLSLLKTHLTTTKKVQLFTEMNEYFLGDEGKGVGWITGTKKSEQMFYMLCKATDRFLIAPEGDCEFGLTLAESNHTNMLQQSSTYRSFLTNPQGLKLKTKNIVNLF